MDEIPSHAPSSLPAAAAQTRAETKLTTVNYKLAHPQFLRPAAAGRVSQSQ